MAEESNLIPTWRLNCQVSFFTNFVFAWLPDAGPFFKWDFEYNIYMWRKWVIFGIGIIFIFAPFLGLTTFIFKFIMVVGGAITAVLVFWMISEEKFILKEKSNVDQEIQEFQR